MSCIACHRPQFLHESERAYCGVCAALAVDRLVWLWMLGTIATYHWRLT